MGVTCYDNKSERTFPQFNPRGNEDSTNNKTNQKKIEIKIGKNSIKQIQANHGSEGDDKNINEKKNKKIERKKMGDGGGDSKNIDSIKEIKNYENGNEKEGSFRRPDKDSDINNSQNKKSTTKSYLDLDFNKGKDYYLLCPDCNDLYPTIRDISYDIKKKDFIISYECDCFNNKVT